jgi:hypothetical protein
MGWLPGSVILALKVGDDVLFLRHIYALKALQPLLSLVSCETDEEQSED